MVNLSAIQPLIGTDIKRLQRMSAMLAANAASDGRVKCRPWAALDGDPKLLDFNGF